MHQRNKNNRDLKKDVKERIARVSKGGDSIHKTQVKV